MYTIMDAFGAYKVNVYIVYICIVNVYIYICIYMEPTKSMLYYNFLLVTE